MDVQKSFDFGPETLVGVHVRKARRCRSAIRSRPRRRSCCPTRRPADGLGKPCEPPHPRLVQIALRLREVRAFVGLRKDRSVAIRRQAVAGMRRPAGVIPKHFVSHGPHRVAGVHVQIGQPGGKLLLEVSRAEEPPWPHIANGRRSLDSCSPRGIRTASRRATRPCCPARRKKRRG